VSGICGDLGRCAYAVASEAHDDGSIDDPCPHWADCFGVVDTDGTDTDRAHG